MVSAHPSQVQRPPVRPEGEPLVCVVDDEETVRQSLGRLLRSAGLPVRSFASAADFLSAGAHPGPCCVVLDMNMSGMGGLDLQRELAGRTERVVFLTGYGDVPMCARAMKAGAVDFLTKPVDEEILLESVSRALELSAGAIAAMSDRSAACGKLKCLTPRERAVMERVVAGMLNKQIAADLGIAEKTIKVHRGRMMRKAGVVSVPELVRLVLRAGAVENDHKGRS